MNIISVRKRFDTTKLKEGICRVGFFADSKYDNAKPVAMVAYANEFGKGVPKRPFMRPALHQNRAKIIADLRAKYKKALKDNTDTMAVLKDTGLKVQGMIQDQIMNTWEPPNAPSTIKKKGFNAPLRDTRIMLHSVRHQEEEVKK